MNGFITTEEMRTVALVFQESYQHVLGNLVGDLRNQIVVFSASVILSEKPYMLLTEEGLQHAIQLVFSNEARRDFLMMLGFTFLSRWGAGVEGYKDLVFNLAAAVAQSEISKEYDAMPEPIRSRLPDHQDAVAVLQANRWLVMILLMQLFISITPEGTRALAN